MAKYKRYTNAFKKKVVTEYLDGTARSEIVRKYDVGKDRIRHWTKQFRETGGFPDGRGKGSPGRPRKTDTSTMTKDEYIQYLEMENDILKKLNSLSNKNQK
jgi:transposase-like protein